MPRLRVALLALALVLASQGIAPAAPLSIYTEQNMPFSGALADGSLTGFSVEVVREIQRRLGDTSPIRVLPWARGLLEAQKGPGVALFSTARNSERDPLYQWVGPLVENSNAFFSLSSSPLVVRSLDEAKKAKTIAVVLGDARDRFLTAAGFANLDRGTDYANAYRKLLAGRVDLVAGNQVSAPTLFLEAGGKEGQLKVQYVFNRTQLWIAFSKDVPAATIGKWQAGLDAMKKDGSFARLHRAWMPGVALPGPPITAF